jgi:hypothetical protein
MWLNMILLSGASLCVGFALGWIVARPRRWVYVAGEADREPESWLAGGGRRR